MDSRFIRLLLWNKNVISVVIKCTTVMWKQDREQLAGISMCFCRFCCQNWFRVKNKGATVHCCQWIESAGNILRVLWDLNFEYVIQIEALSRAHTHTHTHDQTHTHAHTRAHTHTHATHIYTRTHDQTTRWRRGCSRPSFPVFTGETTACCASGCSSLNW